MKKISMVCALAVGLVLTACEKNPSTDEVKNQEQPTQRVEFTFSPYEMRSMTRTVTSISNVCTRLDVWIFEDDEEVADIHQTSSDQGFGTVSLTLNKTKTYTLYAIGHKASDEMVLEDGVLSFPDDKVKEAMWYTATFSPAETTSLSCEMTRIVAQFALDITDPVPAAAKKMLITIDGVYNRWSVTGEGSNLLDRTSTLNISTRSDGTATFTIYAIVTDSETQHNVTATALDASDGVVKTWTFEDVPLRNGYKTAYRGYFFTDQPVTSVFTVGDWSEYDVVDY